MKVKWRKHEFLLVGIGMGIFVLMLLLSLIRGNRVVLDEQLGVPMQVEPFHYFRLKVGLGVLNILVLYGCYRWLNWGIIDFRQRTVYWLSIPLLLVQLGVISYLLGPGINFLSYYGNPYGHGGLQAPMMLGYHPQPFFNLFGGWQITAILVMLYAMYAWVREVCMVRIERDAYLTLVVNRITGLVAICVGTAFVSAKFDKTIAFAYFLSLALSGGVCIIINYYFVFPLWEEMKLGIVLRVLSLLIGIMVIPFFSIPVLMANRAGYLIPTLFSVQLMIVTPISWVVYQIRKDTVRELRGVKRDLQGVRADLAQSKAHLDSLKEQINPHFLFNSLNALYGTALREGTEDTAAGIQRLGDMMRFMLHDNQQDRIAMSREVAYMSDYLALQRLRIGTSPDIRVTDRITVDDEGQLIAPMLLIPFVENAFKHGISLEEPSWISIVLECIRGRLRFEVRNSIHGRRAVDPAGDISGTGLVNVRERLKLLYPGKHELAYSATDHEYVVVLTIKKLD